MPLSKGPVRQTITVGKDESVDERRDSRKELIHLK